MDCCSIRTAILFSFVSAGIRYVSISVALCEWICYTFCINFCGYRYKKTYKSVVPDLMIPICGIAFVGLFTVEFVFEMIRLMPTLS